MKRTTNASHQQTKQTNSENGHTLYLFFYSRTCVLPAKQSSSSSFSFLQAMGWLLWLCRKFRSHLSRTYFVAAGTTTIRPARRSVVAYFDSGLEHHHHNRRGQPLLPTLLHSVRVRFSAAGIWHSRYHIIDNTAPARHTLLPTVVLPIFSSSIFGANNSHSACLLYSIELDRAPAPRT